MKKQEVDKNKLSFIALNPYVESNIILPTETNINGAKWVAFGDKNIYPNYIYNLYENSATLKALIDGSVNFVIGNEVKTNNPILTQKQAKRLVEDISWNILTFGGCYISVLRNKMKQVCKLEVLDYRCVRSDEKNEFFYYSKDFANNKSFGRCKANIYPKFRADETDVPSSIFYFKNRRHFTYGLPVYNAVLTCCEVERSINEYNLNQIKNGFSPSTMISFNNGIPSDEVRDEIEDMVNEKFAGESNAGRIMINFANDQEHSVKIDKIDVDNFADKFNSLIEQTQAQLFTAFHCTPNLMGIPTKTTGFNEQEFNGAYALFYRSTIKPIQEIVVDLLDEILNIEGCIEIDPFKIDFNNDNISVEKID